MKNMFITGVMVVLMTATAVQAASTATLQVVTHHNGAPAMGCTINGTATAAGKTTKFTRHSVNLDLPTDTTVSVEVQGVCGGKTYTGSRTTLLRSGTSNKVVFDLK